MGSAMNGTCSVPWAVQGGPSVYRCVQTVLLRSVGCEEGLCSSDSSSCELWVFKLAPEICLGLPQAGSLFTQAILSLTEIKPPSHTLGSSQSSWEIKGGGRLAPACRTLEGFTERPPWEATSAIALTGVSSAFSSQPQTD